MCDGPLNLQATRNRVNHRWSVGGWRVVMCATVFGGGTNVEGYLHLGLYKSLGKPMTTTIGADGIASETSRANSESLALNRRSTRRSSTDY